jgi:alpha-L-fucosidase
MFVERAWVLQRFVRGLVLSLLVIASVRSQTAPRYEATIDSLSRHPLPQWYADAKFGIFIHWGLYSVPGWAPLIHPEHDFTSQEYITHNPYAEWYLNSMRLDGSPTQVYHREHYGADYGYYNFAAIFNREIKKWNPSAWAKLFREVGAKYVVLTTKHHDGFTLWPSSTENPYLPKDRQHAVRDIVGELASSVREQGLRMGVYYSGGYDWTFVPGPIREAGDYQKVKPQGEAYGKYVDAQMRELIERYHPAVLWNDIDYPKSGQPLAIIAEYYNTIPDGVVDDRFGVKHSDFESPEYENRDKISEKKWEECRGLGRSFGYNRAEGEAETISARDLIHLLVDIVSKNGNLLLDIGPEADGTVPEVQMKPLLALGAWLRMNGEAVYGTHPWKRAVGETTEGTQVRFTQRDSEVYATLLGRPRAETVTIKSVSLAPDSKVVLLGCPEQLTWRQKVHDVEIDLPSSFPEQDAYVVRMTGSVDQ